ncbi:calphotin-like [Procambarus clarkii]|uniref:calphotin-like n=1 Tax=Procambarus clarkii TaxID=6728 RepID=UPI0037426B06
MWRCSLCQLLLRLLRPPVVVASPPEVVSSPGAQPAPAGVPEPLPTAVCSDLSSSSSSSAVSVPVPAPSPSVPAVLGAGVDPAFPPVPGLVPRVVEDAAVLRLASVRTVSVARVAEFASGSDDVRPEPQRSRRSSSWADIGDFDECGPSGDGGLAPVVVHTTVVEEVHLPQDAGAGVSASPSGLVSEDPASAAVMPPLPSPAVSPAVSVEVLPSHRPSPAPVHATAWQSRRPSSASPVSSASSKGVDGAPRPRYATCVSDLGRWPMPPDLDVPDFMGPPRQRGIKHPTDFEDLVWEAYKRKYPYDFFPEKYISHIVPRK